MSYIGNIDSLATSLVKQQQAQVETNIKTQVESSLRSAGASVPGLPNFSKAPTAALEAKAAAKKEAAKQAALVRAIELARQQAINGRPDSPPSSDFPMGPIVGGPNQPGSSGSNTMLYVGGGAALLLGGLLFMSRRKG